MPRKKTYDTREIISFLDEYRVANPGAKITIPKFGAYLRNKGYSIEDHTLRRDEDFKSYLETANSDVESNIFNELVTYKTLDVDAFLLKNNSKDKLKDALIVRDQYYATIAARASESIKAKKQLKESVEQLELQISDLDKQIEEMKIKLKNAKSDTSELKKKNEIIIRLKNILDDYVYPDIANAILKKDGILEVVNNVISNETIEQKSIEANTDINDKILNKNKSKFASIDLLLGDFDE